MSTKIQAQIASVVAMLLISAELDTSYAQQAVQSMPPLSSKVWEKLRSDLQAFQEFLAERPSFPSEPIPPGAPWTLAFTTVPLSNPLLLTDGTVLAHKACTADWYRLTPDINGNYKNGTWTPTAPMPAGYAPQYFGSQILSDGRVLIEGGEYNGTAAGGCKYTESTTGAIYDPIADSWTPVPPPAGWDTIGDASTMALANGEILVARCCDGSSQQAILDPDTLTWTLTGAGKQDPNEEENWTLLPDGNVLTVDADFDLPAADCTGDSEVYISATGSWQSAGNTINELSSCSGSVNATINGVVNYVNEAPTQIMSPWGDVYAFGSTVSLPSENLPVSMSIYDSRTGRWTAGPNLPQVDGINYTMADAPAAVLPDGRVLIAASPGVWKNLFDGAYPSPTHFFIYDGKKRFDKQAYQQVSSNTEDLAASPYEQVGDMTDAAKMSAYEANFLVLPTGEVLATETDFSNTDIFPAVCCANPLWAPRITWISESALAPGGSYILRGRQLSGLTQGATYGDDVQADTNFPLVQITNQASQHVYYARTYGFGRSIKPNQSSLTSFDVPRGIEHGASSLVVIANGIASIAIDVTVQ